MCVYLLLLWSSAMFVFAFVIFVVFNVLLNHLKATWQQGEGGSSINKYLLKHFSSGKPFFTLHGLVVVFPSTSSAVLRSCLPAGQAGIYLAAIQMLLKNENCCCQRISVSEEKVNDSKIHLHVCILQYYTSDVFISQCSPAIQTSLYLPAINMTLKSQKCYSQHVLIKKKGNDNRKTN